MSFPRPDGMTNRALNYVFNEETWSWEPANQSVVNTDTLSVSGLISNWPGMTPYAFDQSVLTYSGDQLTTVTHKASGVTVGTITLTYDGDLLTSVSRS